MIEWVGFAIVTWTTLGAQWAALVYLFLALMVWATTQLVLLWR